MSESRLVRQPGGSIAAVVLGLVSLVAACGSKPGAPAVPATASPDVWAVVDGREIKKEMVEKAYRRTAATLAVSDEEALTAKLALLNELITQDILLARAKSLGLEASAADIDKAFEERRKSIPDAQFQRELADRKLVADDMKDGLRMDLSAQKVMEHEVTAKVTVGDDDVRAFFEANRAKFNLSEPAYHIAQIVVTPIKDPQIANRRNDDATSADAASRKAQMLMERLKAGADFASLAMDYSEDPQTAAQGGDLGLVPLSALNQAPPQLRDAVLRATPGNVQQISSQGAHNLVLLVAKEPAGQRDLGTPGVRDDITANLRERKEQLLRAAYLSAIRNNAVIVNYLAQRVVDAHGRVPGTLVPTPPGR